MDVKIAITFDYKVMPGAYCPFQIFYWPLLGLHHSTITKAFLRNISLWWNTSSLGSKLSRTKSVKQVPTYIICETFDGSKYQSFVLSQNIHILDSLFQPLSWHQEERFFAFNQFFSAKLRSTACIYWIQNDTILTVGQGCDVHHSYDLQKYMSLNVK